MKKLLFVFLLAVLTCVSTQAQQSRKTYATTIVGADTWVRQIGAGILYHELTWNLTGGAAATCQVELDYSNDGITSAGTIIAAQTCTSTGFSAVSSPMLANYVRINVTTKSGVGTINVTYLGFTASPSGGGGGGFGTDCSMSSGADMGAKLNACMLTASTSTGVANASTINGAQNISTAVVNSYGVEVFVCNVQITQTANILLSGQGASFIGCSNQVATLTKAANIDMFEVSGANNEIAQLQTDGASDSAFTGNGVTIDMGVGFPYVHDVSIFRQAGAPINDQGSTSGAFTNLNLVNNGVNAIVTSGTQAAVFTNVTTSSSGSETGPTVLAAAVSNLSFVNSNLASGGAFPTVEPTGVSTVNLTSTTVNNNAGYPAVSGNESTITISAGSQILGGGANGPAVTSTGNGNVTIDSSIITGFAGSDAIDSGGDIIHVQNNSISLDMTGVGGICAVNLNIASLGNYVGNNKITIGGANSAADYGVCITSSMGAGHMANNVVENNVVNGAGLTGGFHDAALFFNNAGNLNTQTLGNVFRTNSCIDIYYCVARHDTQNNKTYYDNNTGFVTGTFWDPGGSTADTIIQNIMATQSFATLPIAGLGSSVYCSDCQPLSIAAAGGQGAYLTRMETEVNGAGQVSWTGNQAVVGQDSETVEVTGNLSPVILIPGASPSGSYNITIYTEVTTSVATSTITVSIAYHDDTGAQTQSAALLSGATAGTIQSVAFPVRFVTGTNLTYSTTTANSAKYKIFARAVTQ